VPKGFAKMDPDRLRAVGAKGAEARWGKKAAKGLLIFALFLGPTVRVLSQVAPQPAPPIDKIRVSLTVTADDPVQSPLASCLARELRNLADVDLVTEEQVIDLTVLAAMTPRRFPAPPLLAISAVASGVIRRATVRALLVDPPSDPALLDFYSQLLAGPKITLHTVETWARSDLLRACQTVVTDFDARVLEGQRQRVRQLREAEAKKATSSQKRLPTDRR